MDDTLIAKPHSKHSKLVTWQYSGTYHRLMPGIALVSLLWVGGETRIPIDYRIYSKKTDGLTKHDHLREMVRLARHRGLSPRAVVFDGWYAAIENLKAINSFGWTWVAWLRGDRIVDFHERLETKVIPPDGLILHLKGVGFIKVFKTVSEADGSEEYLATNNLNLSPFDIKDVTAQRWKVEEYHRGLKQTTGIENCQTRNPRSQRTHIFCSLLSYVALELKRVETGVSWYRLKEDLITNAMRYYLQKPTISLEFAT